MTPATLLGPLSGLQELLRQLLGSVAEADAHRRFHPELASLGWYLGHSVFRESLWLDEVVREDPEITARVRHLFAPGPLSLDECCAALPPREHLLAWAGQIHDEHLRRLASPGGLPEHPLLADQRLPWFLLQEMAKDYERMLAVLHQRRLSLPPSGFRAGRALTPGTIRLDLVEVQQGHYRVGSRGEPAAYDNELPPQAVPLSSFRIARRPVSQAEFLAFIEAGGYQERTLWTDAGWRRRVADGIRHPDHWRRDAAGAWYGIGMNGPADLVAEQPVCGLSHHEASAFAAWVSALGGPYAGCVLQHEYQWEVAARSGLLEGIGQVWEWCANPFHPYPEFSPFPDAGTSQAHFGGDHRTLRGSCLHTQAVLRRLSLRHFAPPAQRVGFSGLRLVFPPAG
jgi:gamma-glutamyl hercynylcysteine S-oxide synthase